MANLANPRTQMQDMERQCTAYLREFAAEQPNRYHEITDPVRFIFKEWYNNHEKLDVKTVTEITKLLDSDIGQFMLERCADPQLSLHYNIYTDTIHARVHGTIDRTSSVEWRLRCADD
jgi:hypothetical protein